MSSYIGIDVSKNQLEVLVMQGDQEVPMAVANEPKGWAALIRDLHKLGVQEGHACMEATGAYGEGIAQALYNAGYPVSVVNPAWVKGHGRGKGRRTKTDRLDAWRLANYCRSEQPDLWSPPPLEMRELRAMTRRLAALLDLRQQERNRLQSDAFSPAMNRVTLDLIAHLTRQMEDLQRLIQQHVKAHRSLQHLCHLLVTIPGIGFKTACCLIAEIQDISRFASAKQLAAYAGLCPEIAVSGLSRSKSRLSPAANRRLRAALFFPALVVRRCSPFFSAIADRHIAAGHCKMSAIGILMHKLLRIVFGVWISGQPFDLARLTS